MVDSVSLIILGRVEKREQKVFGTQHLMPTIVHSIRVNRILKAPKDLKPRSVVEVAQEGGKITRDGIEHIVDDRSYPVFAVGEEYLLFLRPDKFYGGLPTIAFGPGGAFPLTEKGTRVGIPGGAKANVRELSTKSEMATDELAVLIQTIVSKDQRSPEL